MRNSKTQIMVEGAAMIALATVLSLIKLFELPWGGSVTVLSMLPIFVFSIRRGIKNGFLVSFVYSLIQLGLGIMDGLLGWGLTGVMLIACILIDYILAFSVLGIAGIFRQKKTAGYIAGIALACVLRFAFHFLSGVVIWHSYGELWDGFATENSVLYSLLYNGAYMLPELVITLVGAVALFTIPQTKKLFIDTDKQL